jgi:parallel beta-helix repeat protein
MNLVTPTDGLTITADTTFTPGVYHLPQGITIAADDITLDGNGALLIGRTHNGRGITLDNRHNITLKNLHLQGYYHGLYARHCRQLTITNCHIRDTAELPPNTRFLDIWLPAEQAYGGAILLWQVEDSHITHNDLQHQMNGLLTYDCRRLTVQSNLANYNSGFGFHLSGTADSLYEDNHADFCCRYEPRGHRHGHMGADAAGFLAVRGSSHNTFRRNSARLGGDGFFLAGLSPDGVLDGCNDNLFEANDGSYSPNIAFEATFCRGNHFRDNYANAGNYGFWLGFSWDNLLENNQANGNRQAGIAVENGYNCTVRANTFRANGYGLLLWSKRIPAFDTAVPANDTSYNWLIENNHFEANNKAIRIAANQDHGIRPMPPTATTPRPHHHTIRHNTIHNNRVGIELLAARDTVVEDNEFAGNVEADLR